MNIPRILSFPDDTFFLWGPRQSGKTTLLKSRFPDAFRIDLLRTDERMRFARSPSFGASGFVWDFSIDESYYANRLRLTG
jgi:hypothetical protein